MTQGTNHNRRTVAGGRFVEIPEPFFVDPDYKAALDDLGLTSIDAVFSFHAAENLAKKDLAPFRSRLQFEIDSPPTTLFLKRYDQPPVFAQLRNWLSQHARLSCSVAEFNSANQIAAAGINVPKTVSYGEQWGIFFEKRSFIITQKIPDAQSLERKLPDCFAGPANAENLKRRRNFVAQLAAFIRKFHQTNYRHRDLYFSHVFCSESGQFYLIDLARAFKPIVWRERFRVKDIAQLYYSAPGRYFSRTDRLHFYLKYADRDRLAAKDKSFIRKVLTRAERMARHNKRHGKDVPFALR
jgi:hypothetical protein